MDANNMPRDPAQRWEWIKYQLRIRNSSADDLARQLNVTDRAIRAVKTTPYPRIERAIAAALDTQPMLLWPERWNSDGTPKRQRPNRAETTVQYHCTEHAKDSRYVPVPHRKTGTEA
jgi:Ner family transcriptional regulator